MSYGAFSSPGAMISWYNNFGYIQTVPAAALYVDFIAVILGMVAVDDKMPFKGLKRMETALIVSIISTILWISASVINMVFVFYGVNDERVLHHPETFQALNIGMFTSIIGISKLALSFWATSRPGQIGVEGLGLAFWGVSWMAFGDDDRKRLDLWHNLAGLFMLVTGLAQLWMGMFTVGGLAGSKPYGPTIEHKFVEELLKPYADPYDKTKDLDWNLSERRRREEAVRNIVNNPSQREVLYREISDARVKDNLVAKEKWREWYTTLKPSGAHSLDGYTTTSPAVAVTSLILFVLTATFTLVIAADTNIDNPIARYANPGVPLDDRLLFQPWFMFVLSLVLFVAIIFILAYALAWRSVSEPGKCELDPIGTSGTRFVSNWPNDQSYADAYGVSQSDRPVGNFPQAEYSPMTKVHAGYTNY
jgi:hypothetical protein